MKEITINTPGLVVDCNFVQEYGENPRVEVVTFYRGFVAVGEYTFANDIDNNKLEYTLSFATLFKAVEIAKERAIKKLNIIINAKWNEYLSIKDLFDE